MDKEEMQQTFAVLTEQRERLRDDFAAHAALEKDYFKHTLTAKVTFDIEKWMETGELVEGDFILVVYYPYKDEEQNAFAVVKQDVQVAG